MLYALIAAALIASPAQDRLNAADAALNAATVRFNRIVEQNAQAADAAPTADSLALDRYTMGRRDPWVHLGDIKPSLDEYLRAAATRFVGNIKANVAYLCARRVLNDAQKERDEAAFLAQK